MPDARPRRDPPLLLNFAFWTLFGALQASNWIAWPSANRFAYVERALVSALFNAYMWALVTPAIFQLAARTNPAHNPRRRQWLGVLGLGLGVATVTTVLAATAHHLLLPRPIGNSPSIGGVRYSALARWYVQQIITFLVVLVAGTASEVSRRFRIREREATCLEAQASELQAERAELRAHAAQLQARSASLETQLVEARLTMLRSRLNPHFLFNTLNAVSALVATDPRGVRAMIALLSELLRHALMDARDQEIALNEEVRLLRLYLEILEIRYQGQLRTVVTIGPDVQDALVPNLVLQPLVENAMKHGVDRAGGHGVIEVLAHRAGDDLVLTVRDTGPGETGPGDAVATEYAGGVGLRLTRERLTELYADQQRFELESQPAGGMNARVTLPYHTRADVRIAEDVTVGSAE